MSDLTIEAVQRFLEGGVSHACSPADGALFETLAVDGGGCRRLCMQRCHPNDGQEGGAHNHAGSAKAHTMSSLQRLMLLSRRNTRIGKRRKAQSGIDLL